MKIKIEKFWDNKTKSLIEGINDSLKRMEIDPIYDKLEQLFETLKNPENDSKVRVSLCFTLETLAQFEPFHDIILNFLMELLEQEKDAHVKEFAVYILGNIVLDNPNLSLITQTLPIFLKFCKDSSEYVRTCAEDIKNRLNHVKESKIKEQEIIESLRNDLRIFIDERIENLNNLASNISKKALSLDYEAAFKNQEEMIREIYKFSTINDQAETEIREFIREQIKKNPIAEGEFKQDFNFWKETRAQKEDLIRQIHCIIRIQSKIFNIIQYIRARGESDFFTIEELKQQTKGGLRGEWKDEEIIETLEKLVEEEIIPTFFLDQVKDLKSIQNNNESKKKLK
ncbi:MAG: hypothetical protein ACTSR8_08295 [Promethearchaeota archaeon]